MRYGRLGATDLVVSQVALGTAPLGGLFGPVDATASVAVVHEALELGINVVDTSSSYGGAEELLGRALAGRRDDVVVATKAGRREGGGFDWSPTALRHSVERSLRRLRTDRVDVFQLHNIEFLPAGSAFDDAVATLAALRDDGRCRYVGVSGYPVPAVARALRDADLDVALCYAHATLLDDSLPRDLAPVARERRVGLLNAAPLALGLLTGRGPSDPDAHPATAPIRNAARRMAALCAERGADLAAVATQYSIQRSGCVTTVVGTSRLDHLRSAVAAGQTPLHDELVRDLLALRPPAAARTWSSGIPEAGTGGC